MRVDGVEIKVSLEGGQVVAALQALGIDPDSDATERKVGFVEDARSDSDLPLLRNGIVFRVRKVSDGGDNSTVKLRPCRASQLMDAWVEERDNDEWILKVEEDWADDRHVLAASYVSDLPNDRIDEAFHDREQVRRLFNQRQERFLSECGSTEVNFDALTLLPLIDTSRWKNIAVGAVSEICVERWSVDELDFLELSARADNAVEAEGKQRDLDHAVRAMGLERDDATESKTQRVLTHLVKLIRDDQ